MCCDNLYSWFLGATKMKKKITTYEVLVYIAFAFFILLNGTWFAIGLLREGHFNLYALGITLVFVIQAYFQNRIANLILGLLSLIGCIWMLLTFISEFNLMAKDAVFDSLIKSLMGICILGIVMSCLIVFSYTKLSFKEQQHSR